MSAIGTADNPTAFAFVRYWNDSGQSLVAQGAVVCSAGAGFKFAE
jgi:hypothetical protein